MKAASYAMADGARFRRAARLPRLLRAISHNGVIRRLPFPGSLWTRSRDLIEPPKQTFRDWWAEREDGR
jgi:L-lactate dehydrogenase complex protein LldF